MKIDHTLIKEFFLKPWEVDLLTPTEIWVMFGSLQEAGPTSLVDAIEQAKAYNRLTPAEKVELALRCRA